MTTALIGLLGGVLGASITGVLTYILQRAADERRFKHENDTRLREERTKAYGVFFSLARGARAASHRSQTLVAQPGEPTALEKLRDARATVELLRERPELERDSRAKALWRMHAIPGRTTTSWV